MSFFDSILIAGRRSIGTIIPHVTVREVGRDDLVITDHPVERGAAISDHAFKRPSVVEIVCDWSDTIGGEGFVQGAYEQMLALQMKREPFNVVTGKRMYTNMLIQSIVQPTDEKTEYSLPMTVTCREVIIVSTQSTGGSAPQSDHASPQTTAPTTEGGSRQAVEVPSTSEGTATVGGAEVPFEPSPVPTPAPLTSGEPTLGSGFTPGGSFGLGGPNTAAPGMDGITLPTPYSGQFDFTS